jgi:hypothetical protein
LPPQLPDSPALNLIGDLTRLLQVHLIKLSPNL